MRAEFEQAVRQIADEDLARDRGLTISTDTRAAYQRLLALYYQSVGPVLDVLTLNEQSVARYCISFIEDATRTILMIRAINRAIIARRRFGITNLHLVEAGVGSGLLLSAALALDVELKVDGYEWMSANQRVALALLADLRYSTRARLHQIDLLRNPPVVKPHILVAEHINQGLTGEHATKIPRLFDIDPQYVVPYAVVPGVYWNGAQRTDRGDRVILADRFSPDQFVVTGHLNLPPLSFQPVAVCCDVEWGAPNLGTASLLQRSSNCLKQPGWENHLIQAQWLYTDRANRDDIVALKNHSAQPQTVAYKVSYPIGALVQQPPVLPRVIVHDPNVQVTTMFRGRAQLTESLKSVRHRWWKVFA